MARRGGGRRVVIDRRVVGRGGIAKPTQVVSARVSPLVRRGGGELGRTPQHVPTAAIL